MEKIKKFLQNLEYMREKNMEGTHQEIRYKKIKLIKIKKKKKSFTLLNIYQNN